MNAMTHTHATLVVLLDRLQKRARLLEERQALWARNPQVVMALKASRDECLDLASWIRDELTRMVA